MPILRLACVSFGTLIKIEEITIKLNTLLIWYKLLKD